MSLFPRSARAARRGIAVRPGPAAAIATLVAAGLAGCAAPAETRFHSLSSPQAPDATSPRVPVRLGVVTVPVGVDRPQWLVRLPDDSLRLLEQDRWTAPLRDEFRAALREGLAAPADDRTASADAAASSARIAAAAWRLDVDVLRFESRPGRQAELDAQWTLVPTDAGAAALRCTTIAREPVGAEPAELARGHRRALQRLIDDIEGSLNLLQSGATPRCPAA